MKKPVIFLYPAIDRFRFFQTVLLPQEMYLFFYSLGIRRVFPYALDAVFTTFL